MQSKMFHVFFLLIDTESHEKKENNITNVPKLF